MTHTFLLTKTTPIEPSLDPFLACDDVKIVHTPVLNISYIPLNINHNEYDSADCILVTSPHAVRDFKKNNVPIHIPIYCVGTMTATALRNEGYQNIECCFYAGSELMSALRNAQQPYKRFIYFRGHNVQHDVKTLCEKLDFSLQEYVVYRADFTDHHIDTIRTHIVSESRTTIALYSARGALSFIDLVEKNDLSHSLARTNVLCLSDRVLKLVKHFAWKNAYVAHTPTQASFLEEFKTIIETDNYTNE